MALSDYLTRDEWIASYILYLVHSVYLPNDFPLFVNLSVQLEVGILLLNLIGYRGWRGIEVEDGKIKKCSPVPSDGETPSPFEQFLNKEIVLRDYWEQTITWLEAQTVEDPAARADVLEMLKGHLPHVVPNAKVGWGGKFAG